MVKQHPGLRKCATAVAGIGLGLFSATALQAQVTQVDYTSLTGTQSVSFAPVASGAAPGTNYDNVLILSGVGFGEHFSGQTVTANGDFDTIGGTPSGGLTLQPGSPGHNLDIFDHSIVGTLITGLGPLGFPDGDAIGEGAVSLLFSTDQSEFGFRLAGGNGGNGYISFFREDGSLIDSLTLGSLPPVSFFGFARDGGVHDIRGVSIWNDDVTGFGLSHFRYDVASALPEPGTWAMMIVGFGAIGLALRRRRSPALAQVA